jgi:hypothetical protein
MSIDYNQLSAEEISQLIIGLRAVEAEGLRLTSHEQSFILKRIDSPKFVEVVQLLTQRKGLAPLFGSSEGR